MRQVGSPEREERKRRLGSAFIGRGVRVQYTNKIKGDFTGMFECHQVMASVGQEGKLVAGTSLYHTGAPGHLVRVFTACLREC